jgi:hypothetical protein
MIQMTMGQHNCPDVLRGQTSTGKRCFYQKKFPPETRVEEGAASAIRFQQYVAISHHSPYRNNVIGPRRIKAPHILRSVSGLRADA